MTTSTVTWHPVADALPDDDTTVLLAFADCDVYIGYHDDGRWHDGEGYPLGASVQPTHWADLPEPPA